MNPRPTFALRRLNTALLIALSSASAAHAQTTLQEIVVTANRQEQTRLRPSRPWGRT